MAVADRPLSGWRILVTRPVEQSAALVAALTDAGAVVIAYPTIAVQPPPSWEALDQALGRAASYQWVIFSSPSAVRFTFARAQQTEADAAALFAHAQTAAVGAETARALRERGLRVDVVPTDDQRQEGLGDALAQLSPGTRVLFPQAIGGRELLAARLTQQGCAVDVVPVSETAPRSLSGEPPEFDVATFASPSAFRAFVAGHGAAALAGKVIAAIGPTTATAIADAGLAVDVVAPTPSAAGLCDALLRYRRKNSPAVL